MESAFGTPASTAPAMLPPSLETAALAARPQRTAGGQPVAAIVLLDIETKGLA